MDPPLGKVDFKDWLHCNHCFQMYETGIKFNIISCNHVLCEKCVRSAQLPGEGNKLNCQCCKKLANFLLLSNDLDEKYQRFFSPSPWMYANAESIIKFQETQQNHLVKNLRKTRVKYDAYKQNIVKMREQITTQNAQLEKLKQYARRAESELAGQVDPRELRLLRQIIDPVVQNDSGYGLGNTSMNSISSIGGTSLMPPNYSSTAGSSKSFSNHHFMD